MSDNKLLLTLSTALLFNMVGLSNIAVVLPAAVNELHLNATQAGLLASAFFASYAIGVPLLVPLTDRMSPLAVYSFGSLCWIVGALLVGLRTDGMTLALLGRLFSGLGMAATYFPGLMLLLARLPEEHRAAASGSYTSCITLGNSFCFAVSGACALYLPWRSVFLAAAVLATLAWAIVICACLSRPAIAPQFAPISTRDELDFFRRPRVIGVLAAAAGNGWEAFAFRTWWIAYLVFCTGLSLDGPLIAKLALLTAVAGLVAMPVSVLVARHAKGTWQMPLIVLICLASSVVSLVPPLLSTYPFAISVIATMFYLCLIFADSGALPVALLNEAPPSRRGAALAAMSSASNIGAFIGVATVGAALNAMGGPTTPAAWILAFAAMGIGSAFGGLILLLFWRGSTQAPSEK